MGIMMVWAGCKRVVLALPVLLVSSLLVWSYYTFNYCYVATFISDPIMQFALSTGYHISLGMFVWSYYMTSATRPASIPSDFRLSDEQLRRLKHEGVVPFLEWKDRKLPIQSRGFNDAIRFCTKCRMLKPDRSHHCSVCGTCVLKMDHHCPWVNNCVGWHNYKFFILFLFYGILYVITMATPMFNIALAYLGGHRNNFQDVAQRHAVGQIVLVIFVGSALSLSMIGLLSLHIYFVLTNQTTLESFQKTNFIRKTKLGWRQPTYMENIEEVFGKNKWRWLIPWGAGSEGNGVAYKVHYDQSRGLGLVEQGQHLHGDCTISDSDEEG